MNTKRVLLFVLVTAVHLFTAPAVPLSAHMGQAQQLVDPRVANWKPSGELKGTVDFMEIRMDESRLAYIPELPNIGYFVNGKVHYTDGTTDLLWPGWIQWSSSNPAVAIVKENGEVYPTGVGKVTIRGNFKGVTAEKEVTVQKGWIVSLEIDHPKECILFYDPAALPAPSADRVSEKSTAPAPSNKAAPINEAMKPILEEPVLEVLEVPPSQVSLIALASNGVTYAIEQDDTPFRWRSKNKAIADFTAVRGLTANQRGSTAFELEVFNKKFTVPVTVLDVREIELKLEKTEVTIDTNERTQICLEAGSGDKWKDVTWEAIWVSADPSIAEAAAGFITGQSVGTTEVTVTFYGKTATVTVTVEPDLD